jgi:hypothetical protein
MTEGRTGGRGLLFRSSVERKPLFYLLAASAIVAPVVIVAVAVPYFWGPARGTAYILIAAAAIDSAVTWFFAFAFRSVEVTFDGRRVRFGTGPFKTSVAAERVIAAEVVRSGRDEFVQMTTPAGVYTALCRNGETPVQLIRDYKGSEV